MQGLCVWGGGEKGASEGLPFHSLPMTKPVASYLSAVFGWLAFVGPISELGSRTA